jgi:hypothetical protein
MNDELLDFQASVESPAEFDVTGNLIVSDLAFTSFLISSGKSIPVF